MGRFEVEIELTGFKMKLRGDRGDIPMIAHNVGKQFEGMLNPAANIAEGHAPQPQLPFPKETKVIDVQLPTSGSRKKRSISRTREASAAPTSEIAIDPGVWGAPQQTWTCLDKSIWLLYVTAKNGGPTEMTSALIVQVFNTKFRATKTIRPQNVLRDLSKVKTGSDSLVGRNEQNDAWFLTELGEKHAISLITKAREPATSSDK